LWSKDGGGGNLTREEAIQHAEEVADGHDKIKQIKAVILEECKCAEEHRQLAEWLRELKKLREQTRWIPCSERLPKERGWYLGIFKEPDTGWINPLPFICDYVGHETKATTKEHWILRGCTDRGEHIDYYFNLECVAWRPLPESYKGESEE